MIVPRCLNSSHQCLARQVCLSRGTGRQDLLRQRRYKQASSTSSSWAERLRKSSSSLIEQATQTASDQLQKGAKQVVDRSGEFIKSASQSALGAGRNAASSALARGSKLAKKTAQATTDAAQNAASTAASSAASTGSRVASHVGEAASQTINVVGQATASAAKTVGDAAANTVQSSGRALVDEIKSVANTFYTRLWWWSLAAIFVYGLATTLPSVLVDAWKESRPQNKPAIENGNDEEEDSSRSPDSFDWIGSMIFGRAESPKAEESMSKGTANSWASMFPSWAGSQNTDASQKADASDDKKK